MNSVPCSAAMLFAAGRLTIQTNYEAMWNQCKTRFREMYKDVDEETVRFRNFLSNVDTIRATNGTNDQDLMFQLGFDELTDQISRWSRSLPRSITERTLEQIVGVPVPQISEEITVPVPQVLERIVEVIQLIPQCAFQNALSNKLLMLQLFRLRNKWRRS